MAKCRRVQNHVLMRAPENSSIPNMVLAHPSQRTIRATLWKHTRLQIPARWKQRSWARMIPMGTEPWKVEGNAVRSEHDAQFGANIAQSRRSLEICPYCGRSIISIRRHIREMHENRPRHYCPKENCKRHHENPFARMSNLNVHLRNVHKERAP